MPDDPESATSQPPRPPAPPPAPPPRDRGSRMAEGLKSIGKALWFVVSLLLYLLGLAFLYLGKGLIALSGWGAEERATVPETSPAPPPPDPPD